MNEGDRGERAPITPPPTEPSPWDTYSSEPPIVGSPPPPYADQPTQAIPVTDPRDPRYAGTVVQPIAEHVVPVSHVVTAPRPIAPAVSEPVYLSNPEGRGPWWALAAVAALLVGGLVGYLIGHSTRTSSTLSTAPASTLSPTGSSVDAGTAAAVDQQLDSVFTFLAAQARQPGGIQTPTQYPALDDLLSALDSNASAPGTAPPGTADTSALTAERDQLKAQVADLQQQLDDSQAALAQAQQSADDAGGASSDQQAKIDDQAQQIETLQGQLDQTKTDLEAAQSDLDAANKTISDLDPTPVDNVVGQDIAKVRALASSNGWTLVEQPTDSATAQANTVTAQTPPAGANMIKGSVLYVEVATPPKSGG